MAAAIVTAVSCGGQISTTEPKTASELRTTAASSTDTEIVGRWLLAELISVDASAKRARQARQRLDKLGGLGMFASLSRAIDDDAHGRHPEAVHWYVKTLEAARTEADPIAPVAAWYASNRVLHLRSGSPAMWSEVKAKIEAAIASPGALGWRARGELVEWWEREAIRQGNSRAVEEAARMHGCVQNVSLAGPFGRNAASDRYRSFDAEQPGRWPVRFAPDADRSHVVPKVLETERNGCEIRATKAVHDGMFYAQTFFDLSSERDVLVAVQGARAVLIDDAVVLERDPRKWAVWPSFGTVVRLGPGRHRLVARIENPFTAIRLQHPDGRPLAVVTSTDDAAPYVTMPPKVTADPNALNRFVRDGKVLEQHDDVARYLAAYLAQLEGQPDLGSVLMEPLVRQLSSAAAVSLLQQALLALDDPVFPKSDATDVARQLFATAWEKDPQLWRARYWTILDGAAKQGPASAAGELAQLGNDFPQVPAISKRLASLYSQLGWKAERKALVERMAKQFPDNPDVLEALADVREAEGKRQEAEALIERIMQLDPTSEVRLDRALGRHDYASALKELQRIAKLTPDRKRITERIETVMKEAGLQPESFAALERALHRNPQSETARLALADAKYASGDHGALRRAIVDAIEQGADTSVLADALELLEGRTALEPYRIDGLAIVADYQKRGAYMEGAAVRVLDYGVTWVRADGSSRLLEHEIVRVQSQEAISKLAEQRIPRGLSLRMRVIKKDGRIFEPEYVADKPTLTMPHLEVGDYIETESISTLSGSTDGVSYVGPHWFFREQDIGYWRSEFVVISPKDRPLTMETWGAVPEPEVTDNGYEVVRRWRVDQSPAAVLEPGSVPIRELLPSVRLGWGVSLDRKLRRLIDQLSDQTVADPRLVRVAQRIVEGVPAAKRDERARRLYRWILANIEDGDERDPRKIVVGKSGSRAMAFLYMARLVGIPAEVAVVRNRLAQPDVGPMSEVESLDNYVIQIRTESGTRFMTIGDRFTPFGYVPANLRGQPGYLLVEGTPPVTTSTDGSFDGVVYDGEATLRDNGSATIELRRSFVGKYAIALRQALETLPENRLRDVVESQMLAADLPGASLVEVQIDDQYELDKPLTLRMKVETPELMRRTGGDLVLSPPFAARLGKFAALAERQTSMLISEASRVEVRFRIHLPKNGKLASQLVRTQLRDGDRSVLINDRVEGSSLILDRVFDIPAARISPAEYKSFQSFAREADEATQRDVRITIH